MLEIWLLELNYKNKGPKREINTKRISPISFKNFRCIVSKPLAKITATGKAAINSSEPSRSNVIKRYEMLMIKWLKSKIQLFVKRLLTENALPVFIKIANNKKKESTPNGAKKLAS